MSINKRLFRLPEYDMAEMRFVHEGIGQLMNAQDSLFASIEKVKGGETTYLNQNTMPTGQVVNSQPVEMESPIAFTYDQLRAFDVDSLAVEMNAIASKHLEIVMKHMFQHIVDLCTAAGNVVNAVGAPIDHDKILDLFEKVEISFNDDGEPQMPTMVVSPEVGAKLLRLPPPTPAQVQRRLEIMETKRREFDARKRHRKLSRYAV